MDGTPTCGGKLLWLPTQDLAIYSRAEIPHDARGCRALKELDRRAAPVRGGGRLCLGACMMSAVSPSVTGPAGAHFEAQVVAHYLLSMLASASPRGLPGTTIDRIECQRASDGRPLDDIIVHAHDTQGIPAVLEIQVKRSITFAPADPVFRQVVSQIVKASNRADFWTSRYELAVATSQTSRKITGPLQDVLTWARQLGEAETFFARIERHGAASEDMRAFVQAFRTHLLEFGFGDDNARIWQLLRRLQILVYDFTAEGSDSRVLAMERAVHVLSREDGARAGALWTSLIEHAIGIAASGGDTTFDRLRQHLQVLGFRFQGERRWGAARAALAEDTRAALADIGDRIGNVTLSRHQRTALVYSALDAARYVEIRGDAGVGKSAILKHAAQQFVTEAPIIVLRPGRTTPRGWAAMRAQLQFDGTAHELLSDLASAGGTTLFIDNLNAFDDEERTTVCDLVREAATVLGLSIVVTTRLNAGFEEANWLPADALAHLGRADPIVVGEVSATEVTELREAAPHLAPLLSESHAARGVARNLFRLSRLASRIVDGPLPRSEIDMAEEWWRNADGRADANLRERARVLTTVAEQALTRAEPFEVADLSAPAIDALVTSQTLRNTGHDRVAFWHDVLREWAIANRLNAEPTALERLPLDRPASATLARGVELWARMTLERSEDGGRWDALLTRLTQRGIHGSWRRAVLLAVVRSEVGPELVTRAGLTLLRDDAAVLRELIRVVIAVDTQPFSELLSVAGIDPTIVPLNFFVPSGPSWYHLVSWLLLLGDGLPAAAIPDVVDLYTAWSSGMLGRDGITPLLMTQMFRWLMEIETASHPEDYRDQRAPFGCGIDRERLGSLESALRSGFLLFCNRTPELAAQYLRSIRGRDDERNILKFRGSLAQAAPQELADFTAAALIPSREEAERSRHRPFEEPFSFNDHELFPASPAQGPFYELLVQQRETGLSLIRRLTAHAIAFYSRGRDFGLDVITIRFPAGNRVFPWIASYAWSRQGSQHNGLTSGLMALEGWGHSRIEAGEDIQTVLDDVLGPAGSPAASLLVAVDLLISHWPKTREAIIPFLASPELICLDRQRQSDDQMEYSNLLGIAAPVREPAGPVTLASLRARASRQHTLDELLHRYAFAPRVLREQLSEQLHRACERLGEPSEDADLGDPAFMAQHALNLINPDNWFETSIVGADGEALVGRKYRSPQEESRRLQAFQSAAQAGLTVAALRAKLNLALDDPARSSPELAVAAAQWAQEPLRTAAGGVSDEDSGRRHEITTAALITIRDGTPETRTQHAAWARGVFAKALQSGDDPGSRFSLGLRYNPIAIAFVGTVHLLKHDATEGDLRLLLELATCDHAGAAHGFGASADIVAGLDERWPRALLRCALASSLRWRRSPERTAEDDTRRTEMQRSHVRASIDAELSWLSGARIEPEWPEFPAEPAYSRSRIHLPRTPQERSRRRHRAEQYVDHQMAALWINSTRTIADVRVRPWLREVAAAYGPWTATANGAGLEAHADVSNPPHEWNDAYFKFVAWCLPGLAIEAVDSLVITSIASLPDESFYNVVVDFVRSVDQVYFSDRGLSESVALHVRSALATHMMKTRGWTYQVGRSSTSIEFHLGPAVATLFFNDYGITRSPTCYVLRNGIHRLDAFLPLLTTLVIACPCFFVAVVTLNMLEVAPQQFHLPLLVTAAANWLRTFPNDIEFWVEHLIGRRVSKLIETHLQITVELLDPDDMRRPAIDECLDQMVRLGVVEARQTEQALLRETRRWQL